MIGMVLVTHGRLAAEFVGEAAVGDEDEADHVGNSGRRPRRKSLDRDRPGGRLIE